MEITKRRKCAAVFVVIVLTYTWDQISRTSALKGWSLKHIPQRLWPHSDRNNATLTGHLSDVAKALHRAKVHVRGTKTSVNLRLAIETYGKILKHFGLHQDDIVKRKHHEPRSVCPEMYLGRNIDDTFDKGFESAKCSHGKPISEFMTIVAFIEESNKDKLNKITTDFIASVQNIGNITTIIATKPNLNPFKQFPKNINYIDMSVSNSTGYIWNRLISETKTPYVLIARNVDVVTKDARLERLVREIEMLQVPVAAGAMRYPNGHWDKGCYQSVHKNFTLRYLKGYDESFHDCLFCDYVEGPFVASVNTLRSIPFSEIEMEAGFFEDWFLQLSKSCIESIVCPDIMFHVRNRRLPIEKEDLNWMPFIKKWDLYKVMHSEGKTILSDCILSHKSLRREGVESRAFLILNPCKLNAGAYAVKLIMQACERYKLFCEIESGTDLGVVKQEGILPWDKDADIQFPTANKSWIRKTLKDYLAENDIGFKDLSSRFKFLYQGWVMDGLLRGRLQSETMLAPGNVPQTKALFDGNWIGAPRNPGRFARNRYGPEIYKHDVHWSTKPGDDGWGKYNPGKFRACTKPGQHDCLDQYNGDGNLQFMDPLP